MGGVSLSAILSTTGLTIAEGSSPGTPKSGRSRLYPNSDGNWYGIDDAGTITQYSGSRIAEEDQAANSFRSLIVPPESIRTIGGVPHFDLLPMLDARVFVQWIAGDAGNCFNGSSLWSPSHVGAVTAQAHGVYAPFTPTVAGAGGVANLHGQFLFQANWSSYYYARINTNNVVSTGVNRLWIGFVAGGSPPNAANFSTTIGMAFLLDVGVSTTWKYATGDGTTGTNTSSGVVAADNTVYELEVWVINATAYFSINRSTPVAVAHGAVTTTVMQPELWVWNISGSLPTMWVEKVYVESD